MNNPFDLSEYTSHQLDHIEIAAGAGINLAKSTGNKDMEETIIAFRNTVHAARMQALQKESDVWAEKTAKEILNRSL